MDTFIFLTNITFQMFLHVSRIMEKNIPALFEKKFNNLKEICVII